MAEFSEITLPKETDKLFPTYFYNISDGKKQQIHFIEVLTVNISALKDVLVNQDQR
jgi:hypothetical protein